ncbi:zinc finger, PMZ-type containing protein, partial [Tanacetum coccineum]
RLIEHYSKLWEYRQAVLESNPCSTCHLETEDRDDGKITFKRMYIYFKGIKQGWLDVCRKVIGLDGCFLTHTCKGQLLIAIGRDGNNQMYQIAWAVVSVENKDNWAWFLSLLQEDLELGYGGGLTLISDGYKMEQIKELDPAAHKWLVERNPNSWCKAFFEMDRCSAAFENGISESFNSKIVPARVSFKLEDTITPYFRKRLELLKDKQRSWLVYLSGFREVEVKRGDYAYGVNLHTKQCGCRFWELSGIPRVHAMAPYYHMNMEPELGEYQNKMDMKALAEVEMKNAAEEAEQVRIRQIWAENEANDLYWENIAKEFRDEKLLGPKDSLDNAYSFDTILDFQDNERNVHQVSVDLPVNEAPENYTTKESQAEVPNPKPIVPTQESQIQTRSKIRKQVAATTSMRIFVKNRGRSERIAMMKAKKFKFDAYGT